MKRCSHCKQTLSLDEFYKTKAGLPLSWCKVCSKQSVIESQRQKAKERLAAEPQRFCRHCKEPIEVVFRAGPRPVFCADCSPDTKMRKNFGISRKERDAMLAAQGGVCALCGSNKPGGHGWNIDHDRACCPTMQTCGKCVRAILCHACNTGLGLFDDDPEKLGRAIAYLKSFK